MTLSQVRYVNKSFWRNPASAFFTLAFPLIYLVIFTSLLGHYTVQVGGRSVNSSTYYVAAMASFALITACYNNIAVAVTFHFADGQAGFLGTTVIRSRRRARRAVTTMTTTRTVNGKTVVTHTRHAPAHHDD